MWRRPGGGQEEARRRRRNELGNGGVRGCGCGGGGSGTTSTSSRMQRLKIKCLRINKQAVCHCHRPVLRPLSFIFSFFSFGEETKPTQSKKWKMEKAEPGTMDPGGEAG